MNMKRLSIAMLTLTAITIMSCDNNNKAVPAENSAGNATIENILTRTSVRQYDSERTISRDTVEILLRAAMSAPTAVNKQPWQFVVLDKREAIDSLCTYLPYAKMLEHAPLAIVTCGDLTKAIEGEGETYWIQDVSAATENLLLAAHALGLGAVWTGVYPISDRVKGVQKALGMPDSIVPLAVVPIGYPAMDQAPKDKWDPAKIHYNKY